MIWLVKSGKQHGALWLLFGQRLHQQGADKEMHISANSQTLNHWFDATIYIQGARVCNVFWCQNTIKLIIAKDNI